MFNTNLVRSQLINTFQQIVRNILRIRFVPRVGEDLLFLFHSVVEFAGGHGAVVGADARGGRRHEGLRRGHGAGGSCWGWTGVTDGGEAVCWIERGRHGGRV